MRVYSFGIVEVWWMSVVQLPRLRLLDILQYFRMLLDPLLIIAHALWLFWIFLETSFFSFWNFLLFLVFFSVRIFQLQSCNTLLGMDWFFYIAALLLASKPSTRVDNVFCSPSQSVTYIWIFEYIHAYSLRIIFIFVFTVNKNYN